MPQILVHVHCAEKMYFLLKLFIALLRFFISIVKLEPNQISLLPSSFFKLTLDLLGSRDTSVQVNAVEVISIIGTSVQGKEALSSQGNFLNFLAIWFAKWSKG